MLRTDIENIIEKGKLQELSTSEISSMILLYLEDAGLSLSGNGWFEDDSEMEEVLNEGDKGLRDKISEFLKQ